MASITEPYWKGRMVKYKGKKKRYKIGGKCQKVEERTSL